MSSHVRLRLASALVVATLVSAVSAPAAVAAEADGCSAQASSFDEAGDPLGSAAAPGEGATSDDPLDVAWSGPITWAGMTDEVLQDGEYEVTITPANGGIIVETLVAQASRRTLSGEFANEEARTTREGTSTLSDYSLGVPLLTGTQAVDLSMTAAAGSCTGLAYITIIDSPISTATWWLALLLIVVGVVGLVFARPTIPARKG